MKNLHFESCDTTKIGQVFTPLQWAEWAIAEGPYRDWLSGGTVLDPTGGDGIFLEAFIAKATKEHRPINSEMLSRLYMVERDGSLCHEAVERCKSRYGVRLFDSNIIHKDFFEFDSHLRVSSIVGNPPWVNFTQLPTAYKTFIKPLYVKYRLVPNLKDVLWGGSRIDLAAAVLAKCLRDHCLPAAQVVMFVPLSLFMNDGAHHAFRELAFREDRFAIQEIHDLTSMRVFQNVSTRYGLAKLMANTKTKFPIRFWHHQIDRKPVCENARPHSLNNNSLIVGEVTGRPLVRVPRSSIPRQGVNTCGANGLFFFDDLIDRSKTTTMVANQRIKVELESSLLFPLIAGKNFGSCDSHNRVYKYVLLPHDRQTGKPLTQAVLQRHFPHTWSYLNSVSEMLKQRKGAIIGRMIEKGAWWALLGVGPYTFLSHKIVWQAYGKDHFGPELFTGDWVPNQALQAYMSFADSTTAQQVLQRLVEADLTKHLAAGRMAGTASWAQPGKIKTFLELI